MNKNLLTRITLGKVGDNVSISDEIIKEIKEIKEINEEIDELENKIQKYSNCFPKTFLTITIAVLVFHIPYMLIAFGSDTNIFTQYVTTIFGNANEVIRFTTASEIISIPCAIVMGLYELPDYIKQLTRKKKINDEIKLLREKLAIKQEELNQLQKEKTEQTKSKAIEEIKKIDKRTTEVHFDILKDNSYDDSQDYPDETISHDNGNNQSGVSLVKKIKR